MNFEKPYEMRLAELALNDLYDQWWDLEMKGADLLRKMDSDERDVVRLDDEVRQEYRKNKERSSNIEDIMESIKESYYEAYGVEWEDEEW